MDKSVDAFRTISEVADDLDLPQHVLRFWETRFTQIRPLKRGGGRRYYRPDDVDLLRAIRHLLYGEGYTIKGVQRLLKEHGVRMVAQLPRQDTAPAQPPPGVDADADFESEEATAPRMRGAARDILPERLAPEEGEVQPSAAAARRVLPGSAIRLLRSVLADLGECERILGAARAA
jgi:DNA-binding transcriptional MerR regulator